MSKKLKEGQALFLGGGTFDGKDPFKVTSEGAYPLNNLECSHEEADTRILFHCAYASNNGFNRIVV